VDFGGNYIASIEAALERDARTQGRWARLGDADLYPGSSTILPTAGWRITLAPRSVVCRGVEGFHILVDRFFPASDPRIVVPSLKEDGTWPHVEDEGRLCLLSSRFGADPGERILYHVGCALDLLNFDIPTRTSEFQREFATYWSRGARGTDPPKFLSLTEPGAPSREVWYAEREKSNTLVWADSKEALERWFQNADSALPKPVRNGWAVWLPAPPVPTDFPQKGKDVLDLVAVPDEVLNRVARIGHPLPFLVGAQTVTGPVWVVAEIMPPTSKNFRRRQNRSHTPVTSQLIRQHLAELTVRRQPVERIDGAYIHGRGTSKEYKDLAGMQVAVVGCGSLGASVARLLAQAGVGQLFLVDADNLAAHNTSRHALGQIHLGKNKALSLAARLALDFPHQSAPISFTTFVEYFTAAQWEQLEECDLIVSAGIDYVGDVAISRWRRQELDSRAYHVTTWIEPFAMAGHAVALLEDRDISAVVDEDGNSRYRMIKWKASAKIEWDEAGCGAHFQPHGAVDLQRTVALAARLCLDVLAGKIDASTRRVWLGDRDALAALGGTPTAQFDQSNAEKTLPWPADAPVVT
jgi:hypothetical protein